MVLQSWLIEVSRDWALGGLGRIGVDADDAALAGVPPWRGTVPGVDGGTVTCAETADGLTGGRGDCGLLVITMATAASPVAAPISPAAAPATASGPARRARQRPAARVLPTREVPAREVPAREGDPHELPATGLASWAGSGCTCPFSDPAAICLVTAAARAALGRSPGSAPRQDASKEAGSPAV